MYSEEQLVMISALQHLAFCERQCALIHVEQQWADNRATVLGELLHEKVHTEGKESRGVVRTARSLRLVSYRLGLVGQADVVEFLKTDDAQLGVKLSGCRGYWSPFPVEYKKGKAKKDNVDRIQLCAQALCLEEQLGVEISEGALFYGANRRRVSVLLDNSLRELTEEFAQRLHVLIDSGITPAAIYSPKCKNCSLYDLCSPKWTKLYSKKHYEKILFCNNEDV